MAVIIAGYISAKENLAILPFTGGQGDEGGTILELKENWAIYLRVMIFLFTEADQ